jgi:hypothetical protein
MINDFFECPEGSVGTLAFVVLLFSRPFNEGHPTILQLWFSTFASWLPMINAINFVGNIEFGLLWLVNSLEWIYRCEISMGVCQFHLVIVGPVLGSLFQQVKALTSG